MRDYGKVSPQFWLGRTGRSLRGNPEAQVVALYLMTSPHANMLGVYHCPISYIAHETGLPLEGASKGLRSLVEGGFCTYDEDDEYVFVHEFAAHQVGDELQASDNRVKGIKAELSKLPEGQCRQGFEAKYAVAFHLGIQGTTPKPLQSPLQAPSKQLTGAGAEAEEKKGARGTRLPQDFSPDLNVAVREGIGDPAGEAANFRDYWSAKPGKDGVKLDWPATWRVWCRNSRNKGRASAAPVADIFAGAK